MSISLIKQTRTGNSGILAGTKKIRKLPWVERLTMQGERLIPIAATRLSAADRIGSLKARWNIGRMRYTVPPGVYGVGTPDKSSPVFVSANYKMSFDALRSEFSALSAWILVLDTKGINVWCAAGKGTFGTAELVRRISLTGLPGMVEHRTLILPQLGATGVSAPAVKRATGFSVQWGPVRAADIPDWIAGGREKSPAMRRVTFSLYERLQVVPVEMVQAWPFALGSLALAFLYGLPVDTGFLDRAVPVAVGLIGAVLAGVLVFPLLLPWSPGKTFGPWGGLLGAGFSLGICLAFGLPTLGTAATVLLSTALSAFLAMNFTGSTTFTSQSGALLEVDRAVWPLTALTLGGLILGLISRLAGLKEFL